MTQKLGMRGFFEPDEQNKYLVRWTCADELTDGRDSEEVRELFAPAHWW